ncbi:MAG: hypothetical protein KDB61_15240, partial [Planctomycetes bacterium]|nr:hypothetical protein [Planctomycetota bacterium]
GGAVHVAYGPATITDSYFLDNLAERRTTTTLPARGGAIVGLGALNIRDSKFIGNHCRADAVGGLAREALGGAVYLGATGNLEGVLFQDNLASGQTLALGGAVVSDFSVVGTRIQRAQVMQNRCQVSSGGLARGGGFVGPIEVSYGTFSANEAPDGGGSLFDGVADQCIFSGGVPDEFVGTTQIQYSLVPAATPGTGNLVGDPLFWAPWDVHLLPGSHCIDTADPNAPLDGDGTRADMGAIPFDPAYCGPGCWGEISSEPCQSNPNSSGLISYTRMLGSHAVADNLVILYSGNLPVGMPGYYLTAPEPAFAPFFAGSQGNLCVGQGVIRLNQQILFADAGGRVSRTLDLTQTPAGVNI